MEATLSVQKDEFQYTQMGFSDQISTIVSVTFLCSVNHLDF